jgi:16S rRNA (cytosine1402-N4)-methyltransferase
MTLTMEKPIHKPVLLNEAVDALCVKRGGRYVDCTLGLGGHSLAIAERACPDGAVLGIDADPDAILIARGRLADYAGCMTYVNDNFSNLENILKENNFIPADGILFDLGVSSLQLDTPDRGFSFQAEAELDMRFNPEQVLTAVDLVNILPENRVAELLIEYGDEYRGKQIARNIVKNRPIASTTQLAEIISEAVGGRHGKIHPATKTFLALRIMVNHELENLRNALGQTVNCLIPGGRLVVISYHSIEDRVVKQFIKRETSGCICPPQAPVCICGHEPTLKVIAKNIITPSPEEIKKNPRSRSAKLRVVERI